MVPRLRGDGHARGHERGGDGARVLGRAHEHRHLRIALARRVARADLRREPARLIGGRLALGLGLGLRPGFGGGGEGQGKDWGRGEIKAGFWARLRARRRASSAESQKPRSTTRGGSYLSSSAVLSLKHVFGTSGGACAMSAC